MQKETLRLFYRKFPFKNKKYNLIERKFEELIAIVDQRD